MTKFFTLPVAGPMAFTAPMSRGHSGLFWPKSVEWQGKAPAAKLLVNKGRKTERQVVTFNPSTLGWELPDNWSLVENDAESAARLAAAMAEFAHHFNATMQQFADAHRLVHTASLPYTRHFPDQPPSPKEVSDIKDWRHQHQNWLNRMTTMLSEDATYPDTPEALETADVVLARIVPALAALPRPVIMDCSTMPDTDVIALSLLCPSSILHAPVWLEPLHSSVQIEVDMNRSALEYAQDIAASHLAALVQIIALRWRNLTKPLSLRAFRAVGDDASEALASLTVEPAFWAEGPMALASMDTANFRYSAPVGMQFNYHQ